MLQTLRSWWPGALAGLVAIAIGLAVGELVARLVDGASLIVAIGNMVIDNSPQQMSKWAIDTFGTKDKPVLVAGITVTTVAVGTGLGALSTRYWLIGAVGLAVDRQGIQRIGEVCPGVEDLGIAGDQDLARPQAAGKP